MFHDADIETLIHLQWRIFGRRMVEMERQHQDRLRQLEVSARLKRQAVNHMFDLVTAAILDKLGD